MTEPYPQIPINFHEHTPEEMVQQAENFEKMMECRRSVRDFSERPVPRALIEAAIRTAASAPSGAHQQPWTFVAVSSTEIKRQIRAAAEKEEHTNYKEGRMPEAWLQTLAPLGTDWHKPYLEKAPWLVVVFQQTWGPSPDGARRTHYYVKESVGIACGMFIAALHNMGLATLTHTPSPMGFLSDILGRPAHEKPYILFPVGYPADNATVPELSRKSLDEVSVWFEED